MCKCVYACWRHRQPWYELIISESFVSAPAILPRALTYTRASNLSHTFSGNGLCPVRRQAIILASDDLLASIL